MNEEEKIILTPQGPSSKVVNGFSKRWLVFLIRKIKKKILPRKVFPCKSMFLIIIT